jgi:flavodoxin
MKTLIVYYSRDGTTRRIAEELKAQLGADIEEITEPKGRGGPLGWMRSGQEASKDSIVPINPSAADPSTYDLVVVGTPIWAWKVSSPVRSYLTKMSGSFQSVAFFCSMWSNPGETFNIMGTLAGVQPVATAKILNADVKTGSYVEQVKGFADQLKKSIPSPN